MRREFDLIKEDEDFLLAIGFEWETIRDGNMLWILIHDYQIPEGYNPHHVSMAINVPTGYPRAQLDMVYFYPAIARIDDKPIGALAQRRIEGKIWQRWSRHRTRVNPWREGVDNLSTHVALIDNWLEREFEKKPHEVPA